MANPFDSFFFSPVIAYISSIPHVLHICICILYMHLCACITLRFIPHWMMNEHWFVSLLIYSIALLDDCRQWRYMYIIESRPCVRCIFYFVDSLVLSDMPVKKSAHMRRYRSC